MAKKRLIWQLFPHYLAITLVALIALAWLTTVSFRRFQVAQTQSDLLARTRLLATNLASGLDGVTSEDIKIMARASESRITVIRPDGTVFLDSASDPAAMDNHSDRPEVREALAGRVGKAVRFSDTLQRDMLYVAFAVEVEGRTDAIVRMSVGVMSITEALGDVYWQVAVGTLIVAILSAGVSLLVSRRISRPLEAMRQGAERFARGDLSQELTVPDTVEIGGLAEAMNEMASQLDARIDTVTRQRNEREAILASMVEGMIAVDIEGRVISVNDAADRMLGGTVAEAVGRTVAEAIPNKELRDFIGRTLTEKVQAEADIVGRESGDLYLQAHGTVLRDPDGREMGAVVVLNDVTRMRRLERVRSDFVANVSHELRTPITSIKGFVENLRDGAVGNPERAARFLKIIARQADRLNAIIEDLLLLADVEKDTESDGPLVEAADMARVLNEAAEDCAPAAQDRGITVNVDCPKDLTAKVNPILVEQAVTNLVDNAIKYSGEGSTVEVNAMRGESGVEISVSDHGAGIAADQLPRLFERFYRVDKARSRQLGGTGLGLAIVKHIAEAHGGSVSVESAPGKGSVFTIRLPSRD